MESPFLILLYLTKTLLLCGYRAQTSLLRQTLISDILAPSAMIDWEVPIEKTADIEIDLGAFKKCCGIEIIVCL